MGGKCQLHVYENVKQIRLDGYQSNIFIHSFYFFRIEHKIYGRFETNICAQQTFMINIRFVTYLQTNTTLYIQSYKRKALKTKSTN